MYLAASLYRLEIKSVWSGIFRILGSLFDDRRLVKILIQPSNFSTQFLCYRKSESNREEIKINSICRRGNISLLKQQFLNFS